MNAKVIQLKAEHYAPWVLVLFHIIGLAIFVFPTGIKGLSGGNIFLCALLVFATAQDWKREGIAFLGVALGGLLVEHIGVHTGYLFGEYSYGNELGGKFYAVPLVLGLNWYVVVATATHVVRQWAPVAWSWWQKVGMVALLCVALDYAIEPVAMRYDFWNWEGGIIPFYNYVCWFVFAGILGTWYGHYSKGCNRTAYLLFGIWTTFFILLNIL